MTIKLSSLKTSQKVELKVVAQPSQSGDK